MACAGGKRADWRVVGVQGSYAIETGITTGTDPGPICQINFLVPEPTTLALLAGPVLVLAVRRRRSAA